MKLRLLLAALGLFAVGSGSMKNRARVRDSLGGGGFGVTESLFGVVLLLSQGLNVASDGVQIALGWMTIGVIVVSNIRAVLGARNYFSRRLASEGHRLYTQIKFQEAPEDTQGGAAGSTSEGAGGQAEDDAKDN